MFVTQLPRKEQYVFGLKTVTAVLQNACVSLHQELHHKLESDIKQADKRRATSAASGQSADSDQVNSSENSQII